jgi:hypothetical protein
MFGSRKSRLATVFATMLCAFAVSTSTAAAQGVGTAGLVNVVLVDFLDVNNNNVQIQVPVSVAANVCDVNAAVLVQQFADDGDATCDADATSFATAGSAQGGGNGPGGGQGGPFVGTAGLVNVVLVDVVDITGNNVQVQVPVSVAANVCDVNVAILVQEFQDTGAADCDSTSDSRATARRGQGGGNA